jgi:uncharacterized protein
VTGACDGTGTWSFRCSACGRCCNSPPQLAVPELFRHERVFIGSLAISKVSGDRFAIAARAFGYPSRARCPALADGRCTIHGDGKPATCAAVPLDPLVPDRLQHVVLARRAGGPESVGSDCIMPGEREGFGVLTHDAQVMDPAFRDALARRRADLAADERFWGAAVFELLKKDLLSSAAVTAKIPADGFLSLSLAPALLVLAPVSDGCRERCLQYVHAQLALIRGMVEEAVLRRRREDRTTTEQLRVWARAYESLANALASPLPERERTSAGDAWRSEVEAWLGVSGASSKRPGDGRASPAALCSPASNGEQVAEVEYADELVAEARQLGITPKALHTYLQAGAGKRAPGVSRSMHATIKPIGSACNLDCTYCYYVGKERLLGYGGKRIEDALLEAFIADYIRSQDAEEIAFTWHGGEPTLLGLEFFEKVVRLQAKHAPPGRRVSNDLQTNGSLLSDAWCAFLAKNGFLVGLSVDGPKHLHDLYRRTRNGESSSDAVLAASRRLRRFGVPFGTLTTVNRINATMPLEVYRFLRDEIGSTSMQFIPCVEPSGFERIAPGHHARESLPVVGSPASRPGHAESAVTSWSVDPEDWGGFLCATFDEWSERDVGRVKVNHFESLIAQLDGRPALSCTSSPFCGKNVAVEHDGRVYSCDHFVYPEHELGRIGERSIGEVVFSRAQLEFGLGKCRSLARQCKECSYLGLCWGECPRTRILRTGDGEPNLSYLCRGWKRFFAHAVPLLELKGPRRRSRSSRAPAGQPPPADT